MEGSRDKYWALQDLANKEAHLAYLEEHGHNVDVVEESV